MKKPARLRLIKQRAAWLFMRPSSPSHPEGRRAKARAAYRRRTLAMKVAEADPEAEHKRWLREWRNPLSMDERIDLARKILGGQMHKTWRDD